MKAKLHYTISTYRLLLYIMMITNFVSAQTYEVKGKIVNIKNESLQHVNIIHNGTKTLLSSSNAEGEFRFKLNSKCLIEISLVGYRTKYLFIESDSLIHIKLEESAYSLDEVVVNSVNIRQLYDKCVAKLYNTQMDTIILQKAFYRMTSTYNHKVMYELVEAHYLSQLDKNGVYTNELQNGRYGFIDSMYAKGAVYSLDFSRLITELKLNNAEDLTQTKYPVFPFFRNNAKNKVTLHDLGSFADKHKVYHKIRIIPNKNFSGGVFQADVTINKETFAIKKVLFKIHASNKNIIQPVNKVMQIFTDTIELAIDFNDNYSNFSIIQNISMNMIYRTIRPVSVFSTRTIYTKTTIDYIGYELPNQLLIQPDTEFLDDRDVIQHTLYLNHIWENQQVLKPISIEQLTIDYFNEKNLFKNKFETQADTLNYLGNRYGICKAGRIFETDTIKPKSPRNELVLRHTFDKENYDTSGEYYFDIHVYTAFDDCSFHYVVIPVYDLEFSWRNSEMIDADMDKQLQFALNKLTLDYSDLLKQTLSSINSPCMNKTKIESAKNNLLNSFYEKRDALIASIWKEALENKIYFICPKKSK
jgi:hypothetical protein